MRRRHLSISSLTELFKPNNPRGLGSRDLSKTRLESLRKEILIDDHLIPIGELYIRLQTNPTSGLSSDEAIHRLREDGRNALTPTSEDSMFRIFIRSMFSGFSILIWFGALLCIIAYVIQITSTGNTNKDNLYLGCVLIFVDIVCGLFTFYQERKGAQIMKSFNALMPAHATCIRDGVTRNQLNADLLVKGDIVLVKAGQTVPADIRIIDSRGFKVDNSSLTGESTTVSRSNTTPTENILESHNVAFFSTQCVEGWARGVVIACGDVTAIGRVAGLAARLKARATPLSQEVRRIMRLVSSWAAILGVLVATAALSLGYGYVDTIVLMIGIIVANVPEGLQATVTASLALTAKRMASKNCLVKNLEAIETMGCITVICSDKTGTLTENRMTVAGLWFDVCFHNSNEHNVPQQRTFQSLRTCAILSNHAESRDAGENALETYLQRLVIADDARKSYPLIAEIPFNSTNKYQLSIHTNNGDGQHSIMMKGAPEVILERCSKLLLNGKVVPLSNEFKQRCDEACSEIGNRGERVLAFAELSLPLSSFPKGYDFDVDDVNFPMKGLTFLGLISLSDPPRKEVGAAINTCRGAGIRVLMVTGDHPATARAVAYQVGVTKDPNCRVLTGLDLSHMDDEELEAALRENYELVFARTSPTQKLRVVEACQRGGDLVAVTGDGVNDSPALKKADIGISMGITGSEVAKQTADMVLLDDNFASIVIGIEEGRKIFDNLKKCICYVLISNVPEILPVFFFIILAIPMPIGVITILCVDLGTDMWPAISLAYEKAESVVMLRPPRRVGVDNLVNPRMIYLAYAQIGLIETAAGMFSYFFVMAEHGFFPSTLFGIRRRWDSPAVQDLPDSYGQEWTYDERKQLEYTCHTAFFVSIVMTQLVNVIICKTRFNSIIQQGMDNMVLNAGLVFEILVACFVTYCPGMDLILKTYPLQFRWWLLPIPFSIIMLIYDEFRKYMIRKKPIHGWYYKNTYY